MFITNKNIKNKFKIACDFSYNILSSIISVGVLQLLLYPMLAKTFNSKDYGQLLTIMGIVNTISSSIGNTLNNTRLIQNTKYEDKKLTGDFNILLAVANIFGFFLTIIIGNILFMHNLITNILLSILVVLISIKSYFLVAYRLKLNYKLNLLSSIITSIGYLVGIAIVNYTLIWPLAFIVAEIFNIVFLFFTIDLHKEPYKVTELFKNTASKYSLLILTGLIGNLLVYLDRLIIYPVLGGEYVSAYTTAALFGKSFGIVMTPIAGVLLSYFSQKTFVMTKKRFWKMNLMIFIFSTLFFFFSLIAAPWFTEFFYPTLVDGARSYILYANIAAIIGVTSSIIQPSVLKFAPTYWQVVKEIIYGIIYIGLSFVLLKEYGIIGFCWAAIIANSIKLFFLCIIGTVFIEQKYCKIKDGIKNE